jgi:hypothetical protein
MSEDNKKKDDIKFWWEKDEKDYSSIDRSVMEMEDYVDILGYENLPEWKKKLFNNQMDKYYNQKDKR